MSLRSKQGFAAALLAAAFLVSAIVGANALTQVDETVGETSSPAEVLNATEPVTEGRLAEALAKQVDVAFKDATLDDVAAWVREGGEVNVVVDRKAIEDAGIDLGAVKLSLSLRQVSLDAALWHLLRPHELVFAANDDALSLTTFDKASTILTAKVYAVGDLIRWQDDLGRDHRDPESLAEFIFASCSPSMWSAVGGPGHFAFFEDTMTVSQTWEMHRRIAVVLATLRDAIKRQAAGDFTPTRLPRPNEADERVLQALRRNVDIDATKMPLTKFAKLISELAEVHVTVDTKSLADAGLDGDDLEITGKLNDVPLDRAVRRLLREVDLDFVATHEALLLHSRDSGGKSQWLTRSIYPVADLSVALGEGNGDDRVQVDDLILLITSIVDPTSWEVGGGPGPVRYLEPWDLLLISQSDDGHREIETLLTEIRRLRTQQRQAQGDDLADADLVELRVYGLANAQGQSGEARGPTAQEVAEVVRDLVEPQSWGEDGVYLRALSDRLVVRHRRSVQAKVKRMIRVLQSPE